MVPNKEDALDDLRRDAAPRKERPCATRADRRALPRLECARREIPSRESLEPLPLPPLLLSSGVLSGLLTARTWTEISDVPCNGRTTLFRCKISICLL